MPLARTLSQKVLRVFRGGDARGVPGSRVLEHGDHRC